VAFASEVVNLFPASQALAASAGFTFLGLLSSAHCLAWAAQRHPPHVQSMHLSASDGGRSNQGNLQLTTLEKIIFWQKSMSGWWETWPCDQLPQRSTPKHQTNSDLRIFLPFGFRKGHCEGRRCMGFHETALVCRKKDCKFHVGLFASVIYGWIFRSRKVSLELVVANVNDFGVCLSGWPPGGKQTCCSLLDLGYSMSERENFTLETKQI
jgi:hypothetical protein